MNQKLREDLEGIQEKLEAILEKDEYEERFVEPQHNVFRMSLAAVRKMIDAGMTDIFQVGDMIWNRHEKLGDPLGWIVIGKNRDGEDSLTLWCVSGLPDRPFDTKSNKYPYGHALWSDCSLRYWLNNDLLNALDPEDADAIALVDKVTMGTRDENRRPITTQDKLWLLSACEAGFEPDEDWSEEEGAAYPYFGSNEDRQIGDWWRLRSATRGNAYYTWYVYASGYASASTATTAHRPAPACVIRKS